MTATTEARPQPTSTRPRAGGEGVFRSDIQGLRAVAVLLVLAYHAGVPGFAGGFVGVDVFFVISGFLITGLMVREIDRTGRLDLGRFYARRIRRLLPAVAFTLVGVALLTVAALPATRWKDVIGDIVASSVYLVNWRLADRSVDYLASEQAASPVQHFWSLAVEEQFYVVWPLLILALVWWQRRGGASLRRVLAVGLAAIAVPSLVWSIVNTAAEPGRAYFVTTTRLWELAIGALLAIGATRLTRLPLMARRVLGWGGLLAVAVAAVRYSASTPFPGVAALLPTLGAAAVLAAGTGAPDRGVGRLLRVPVMQDVGAISYSLYLWHWPVVVAATAVWGRADGTLWLPIALLAVTASAAPAWFTYRAIEWPLHHAAILATRPRRAYVVGAACTAIGLVAAGWIFWMTPRVDAPAPGSAPGAVALGSKPAASPAGVVRDSVAAITPDPLVAADDLTDKELSGCNQTIEKAAVLNCVLGDPHSDFTVALVGDSHAWQWAPALRILAERKHWRLEILTKSSCGFFDGSASVGKPPVVNRSCEQFNGAVQARLLGKGRPDVVVSSGINNYRMYRGGALQGPGASHDLLVDAYAKRWASLATAGIPQVVIRNTPWAPFDLPECVSTHSGKLSRCAFDRSRALGRAGNHEVLAAAKVPNATLVDLTDYLCPRELCPPVIGGTMVWRDSHHLTATYARSLAGPLGQALLATRAFR
jgi:peptidoglycan/LPS O-acetylase OafA/YrhL